MNFSKNRIKTLLKKKNKVQSRKRYKKKHKKNKKALKNKKNSFRRKKINIRRKSIKKYKSKRIAKKKRKAYIKQKGGFKKINWYETKREDVDKIIDDIPNIKQEQGIEYDFDAYSFDFLYLPRITTRDDLMKEFKNITEGLPAGYSPEDEASKRHDDDGEGGEGGEHGEDGDGSEYGSKDGSKGGDHSGEMESNTSKHLASINDCTPETIIHVGDGTPGNRRSYLFQDAPKGCNPKDSIDVLWKNLFDMGI